MIGKSYILKPRLQFRCFRVANFIKTSKATSKSVLITVVAIVVIICVTAGFIAYLYTPSTDTEDANSQTPSQTFSPTATPTAKETPTNSPIVTAPPLDEKISIQTVQYDQNKKVVTIYAQSLTETSALDSIIIKDASENTVATLGICSISPNTTGNILAVGTLYSIQSTANSQSLITGSAYTATLTTVTGSSFVSPVFIYSEEQIVALFSP